MVEMTCENSVGNSHIHFVVTQVETARENGFWDVTSQVCREQVCQDEWRSGSQGKGHRVV